jgi:uncharacterized protein YndB with AHSA1/START domain
MAIVAVGLFQLPSSFRVRRAVTVQAPPERIYAEIADLQRWPGWTVGPARDPQMEWEVSAPSLGPGSWLRWTSLTEGRGEVRMIELQPDDSVEFEWLLHDFSLSSRGRIFLRPTEEGVAVIWENEGEFGDSLWTRLVGSFVAHANEEDIEVGLQRLKALAEESEEPPED